MNWTLNFAYLGKTRIEQLNFPYLHVRKTRTEQLTFFYLGIHRIWAILSSIWQIGSIFYNPHFDSRHSKIFAHNYHIQSFPIAYLAADIRQV